MFPFSTIVECKGELFRLSFPDSRPPSIMSPVIFSTEYTSSFKFRHSRTFEGTFKSICFISKSKLQPPLIEGFFSPSTEGRVTFNYNPDNMFYYPVQTTVLTKMRLGVKLNVPVQLAFSIRPPSPQNTSGVVFPFPKDFQDAQDDEDVVEDRFGGIPPDEFLHDVANHPVFGGQIAIGLPENVFFPTLSYSDFFNIDRRHGLNWASILKCVRRKYERLAPTCTVAAGFSKLLEQFSGGDLGRTLLIFPNRWPQFDLRAAFSLAQIILSQSALNVFVVAHAHPLSTPENAHELNPHLTGYSSLAEVEERIFVGCPVGLGEARFG